MDSFNALAFQAKSDRINFGGTDHLVLVNEKFHANGVRSIRLADRQTYRDTGLEHSG